MTAVESLLASAAVHIVTDGLGLPDDLLRALREAQNMRMIGLTLESTHGPLVRISQKDPVPDGWRRNSFPSFVPSSKTNKRFGLSISEDSWEAMSCFSVYDIPFYSRLSLYDPSAVQDSIRLKFITILDHFNSHCRKILYDFLNGLMKVWPDPDNVKNHNAEKSILEKAASFSNKIDSISLIDNDGFILNSWGNAEKAENIAASLAMFYHRTIRDLKQVDTSLVESLAVIGDKGAMLVGPVKNTRLALALSARGERANVLAPFVNECAHMAMEKLMANCGILWGTPVTKEKETVRYRESWFSLPKLIAKGKYVSSKGRKTFHVPSCQAMVKTNEEHLFWFDKRSDAIRTNLTPCKSCNP